MWDCGAYESVTISEGTAHSDKSNDCQMLVDWMSLSEHQCGLWVCGDDIAFDLDGAAGGSALLLMSSWCGVDYVATSNFEETGGRLSGGVVTPLLTGSTDSGIFVHSGVPDKLYASGACFIINQFDCLEKTAGGKYALSYPSYLGTNQILDLDVQGALQVQRADSPVMIFIAPPSLAELEARLRKRGTESEDTISLRLDNARTELKFAVRYDYLIINGRLEDAIDALRSIIVAERCRRRRSPGGQPFAGIS